MLLGDMALRAARRKNGMIRKALLSSAAISPLMFVTPPAQAAPMQTLSIGLAEQEFGGGSNVPLAQETSSTNGSASISTSFGTFTNVQVTATGAPAITQPNLGTTASAASGGSSPTVNLDIYVTDQNLTGPLGTIGLFGGFDVNTFLGTTNAVTINYYIDSGNGQFGNDGATSTATLVGTQSCFSTCSAPSTLSPVDITGTYSETIEYIIGVSANDMGLQGQFAGDGSIITPVPAALPLFAGGLAWIGGFLRKRRGA